MTTQTPLSIAVAFGVSSIVYLFLIVMLNMVFGVTAMEFLTGDSSEFLNRFIRVLRTIGVILTVADFIIIADFILSLSDDGF